MWHVACTAPEARGGREIVNAKSEALKQMALKLVLIDGHSILNRAFYGVPDLTNGQGLHTNAIFGFLNIMFKILEEEQADYLAVAFDVHAPTFRHEIYKEYKGTRKPMPTELRDISRTSPPPSTWALSPTRS